MHKLLDILKKEFIPIDQTPISELVANLKVIEHFFPDIASKRLDQVTDGEFEKVKTFTSYLFTNKITSKNTPFIKEMLTEINPNFNLDGLKNLTELSTEHLYQNTGLPKPSRAIVYTIQNDILNVLEQTDDMSDPKLHLGFLNTSKPRGAILLLKDGEIIERLIDELKRLITPNLPNDGLQNKLDSLEQYFATFSKEILIDYFLLTNHRFCLDNETELQFSHYFVNAVYNVLEAYPKDIGFIAPTISDWTKPIVIYLANIEAISQLENPDTLNSEIEKLHQSFIDKQTPFSLNTIKSFKVKESEMKYKDKFSNNSSERGSSDYKRQDIEEIDKTYQFDTKRFAKKLNAVIKKMRRLQNASNSIKKKKKSTMVANRRNPNDPNLAGTYKKNVPYADLHIYLDTSGSIQQEEYISAIQAIAEISKTLKFDIYFSSFSHILSEESFIQTKGLSEKAIVDKIINIPKVTGGTNFQLIWQNIQREKTQDRINLIISDMEYYPTYYDGEIMYPHTFYTPIKTEDADQQKRIQEATKEFISAMALVANKDEKEIEQYLLY